ncbi:MAG: hypothetical protein D6744_02445 [Planctomycetota bacterium]|nr:MAG: hypothetical protein D6744_02445 [Planctomycetota bacterium]
MDSQCGIRRGKAWRRFGGRRRRENRRIVMNDWTILHAGALGDLILSLHFFEHLCEIVEPQSQRGTPCTQPSHPADVIVVSRADPGDLCHRGRDWRRVSIESVGAHWLYGDTASDAPPAALVKLVRERRVLNLLTGPDEAPHRRLRRIGADMVLSVDPRPASQSAEHITTQWLRRAAAACDARPWRTAIETALAGVGDSGGSMHPPAARRVAADCERNLLIHPGAGAADKCWPLECFLRAADRLASAGHPIRFIVGEVERERWPPAALARMQAVAPVTVAADIRALRAELERSAALLGNDSGPAHLAAWLGLPVLALFGPTDARVWRPIGPYVRVLQGEARARSDWGLKVDTAVYELFGLLEALRAT